MQWQNITKITIFCNFTSLNGDENLFFYFPCRRFYLLWSLTFLTQPIFGFSCFELTLMLSLKYFYRFLYTNRVVPVFCSQLDDVKL